MKELFSYLVSEEFFSEDFDSFFGSKEEVNSFFDTEENSKEEQSTSIIAEKG